MNLLFEIRRWMHPDRNGRAGSFVSFTKAGVLESGRG